VVRHTAVSPSHSKFGRLSLGLFAAIRLPFGLKSRAMGNAMEPGPERILHPEGPRLAHQHEEGRLEGVTGIVIVAQDGPASTPDHRPVPRHQGGERQFRLFPVVERIPLDQLTIREPGERSSVENSPQSTRRDAIWVRLQVFGPPAECSSSS
jgi:hypothetical protein